MVGESLIGKIAPKGLAESNPGGKEEKLLIRYVMKARKLCGAVGFAMMLMMSGMGESNISVLLIWMAVSLVLMYIGRMFDFQTKNKKEERR